MTPGPVIVWFRNDLRLKDNPAFSAAMESGGAILPLYILDETETLRPLGAAQKWWLHGSLNALRQELSEVGAPLILRRGVAADVLKALVKSIGASAVYWNRRYDPASRERDQILKSTLKSQDVSAESFNASLLVEPWALKTGGGKHYQVFTPFWKALTSGDPIPAPLPGPKGRVPAVTTVASDALESWRLLPEKPDWAGGLRSSWTPGSGAASAALTCFLSEGLQGYGDRRNRPDLAGTSRLSPHLHWGEIGPRQIWRAVTMHCAAHPADEKDGMAFLRELGWRDFAHVLLFHAQSLPDRPIRAEFERFPWLSSVDGLEAWRRGQTGYPIVDAGMRELWHTGWMHNRVRMIAASFLVKDLLVDWREGEKWFWDTLVDADLANNPASWQWVAGCGADAAPFFRIFNPVLQGEKFDPEGTYIRRWAPELARTPTSLIHQPWRMDAAQARAAGVTLGVDYPRPIVDHHRARDRALAALATIKSAG